MTTREAMEQLVEEGRDDHVGLWEVVRAVRQEFPVTGAAEVRRATLDLVRDMLDVGGMVAGRPTQDWIGFAPWTLTTAETLRRIEGEWLALGRDPSLWEIVWFYTPD